VYHHGVDPVTAFVLAGGKSSRMGPNNDKALFTIGGRTLLERALILAQACVGNERGSTWIVGSADKFTSSVRLSQTSIPGKGLWPEFTQLCPRQPLI